ncbi:MAG: hypothetical protein IRY99_07775 [Isosphaeraceae bacterium]|nr:hypothetical protein [Isosphaeraceae bacterium]
MRRMITAATLALLALCGCTLIQSGVRKGEGPVRIGSGGGRLIQPKRCTLKMVLLKRPIKDETLNEVLWGVADLQVLDDEARRALEANGLRFGLIAGELPPRVQALLDPPPPEPKVEPTWIIRSSGESLQYDLAAPTPQLDLFLSQRGKTIGKVFYDAKGCLRLTVHHDDTDGVALRVVPEIHHGPIQQGWGPAPLPGALGMRELVPRHGQAEESFRDLAATLDLRPNQIAVLGCLPDRSGTLGAFLFTETEGTSDRLLQKVLLVWGSRGDASPPGSVATPEPKTPAHLVPIDPAELTAQPAR